MDSILQRQMGNSECAFCVDGHWFKAILKQTVKMLDTMQRKLLLHNAALQPVVFDDVNLHFSERIKLDSNEASTRTYLSENPFCLMEHS